MNFGLVAHRLHWFGSDSGLLRWARACEPGLRALGLQLHATGGAHDALFKHRVLGEQLQSVGSRREGGLMRLVSRVAGGLTPADALEGVFFMIDPVDPTSMYPEALALNSQRDSRQTLCSRGGGRHRMGGGGTGLCRAGRRPGAGGEAAVCAGVPGAGADCP